MEEDPYKRTEILTQIINLLPYFAEYVTETKEVMKNKAHIYESQTNTIET
jgi:hypothetical protein